MPSPTIDRATFAELEQTAGAEFAVELVDTFLTEAPTMLADLRRALAVGDADAFRRTAHSLKSNGNTFGAGQAALLPPCRGLRGGRQEGRGMGPAPAGRIGRTCPFS